MDTGKGKVIEAKKKISNKWSSGSKAKGLIAGSEKVIVDPTIKSDEDAKNRVLAFAENMSYRFGTASFTLFGIPEIIPGKFIQTKDMGDAASNKFYVTNVRHKFNADGFQTIVTAQANKLK